MRILTDSQYQIEAKLWFEKVFNSNDVFGQPFTSSILKRLILYPCETYLDDSLLEALVSAASDIGDKGCYLKRAWNHKKSPNHFYVELSELIEAYEGNITTNSSNEVILDIDFWLDYAIYSASGQWGFMVSHERHGLLGGSSQFIDKVSNFIPNLDSQIQLFIQKLQSLYFHSPNATLDWVYELFTHIYGRKIARKLLIESGLGELI